MIILLKYIIYMMVMGVFHLILTIHYKQNERGVNC